MQADDPPYLSVGTAVSAKYKGAFCEAKVSKVVRSVKCRVTYKMGLGTAILNDDQIKGALRVGQLIQAEHPNRKELVDATITKIQDYSQYTVVFDDGDITTLRRTALCLKSGRHFNESETLDQLPLTHPEHFGNPVVGGRRGRRSRQPKDDSSDGEVEEENEPDLEAYLLDLKRVVSVELTEKKRSKDNWFPGVVVIPSAQPTVRINMKDEYLIRSFKDGRYYTVPKKEVSEFNRNMVEKAERAENFCLVEAIQKAIRFLDHNELPPHWEKSDLFNSQLMDSESDRMSDSSDDEPCEEKDRFVAQLYKFMDDAGTPLNKTPTIANRDIDLHRLFRVVQKLGGYNRVTNQNKWRMVTARLYLPNNQNTFNQVKAVYKKCLSSYETFYRTLGVTMLNHTRPAKKNKGRSLIRDKDRSTPIHSPGPEREEESAAEEKKPPSPAAHSLPAAEPLKSKRIEKKRAQMLAAAAEASDTYSSDATDQSEVAKETGRPKRDKTIEAKVGKEKRVGGEKVKALVEKFEEQTKKEEEDKGQLTRSKSQFKQKEPLQAVEKEKEKKSDAKPLKETKLVIVKSVKKPAPSTSSSEDDKKKGKKRMADIDSGSSDSSVCTNINIGDKLKVYYGPTNESKVTYEAKVIEIDKDQTGAVYLVHYTGWNTRYDEWIQPQRIAENLSATTKAKRTKQSAAGAGIAGSNKSNTPKTVAKRGRVTSVSARSSTTEVPRSTTPSSVTSSGSRTKSPGTPATRSTGRLTRQDSFRRTRRISAHTDVSNHTESDSDGSASEDEMSRTRSGAKSDETEVPVRTYQKKVPKPPMLSKADKRKDDEETEKEEDHEKVTRRTRKIKKSPEKSAEESEDEEDESNPPKGRDFDLNQIRSELKGFAKAIKLSPLETMMDKIEKEAVSSSDDSTSPPILEKPEVVEGSSKVEEEEEEKKEKPMQKSTSSEDIYEFKEPEPFEFESRPKLGEEKKRLPRIFEDIDKSPSKRIVKMSPEKLEAPDSPDRHLFRRLPVKKQDFSEEEEDEEEEETIILSSPPKEEEDPFDKLVESPCFNIVKSLEKPIENREKVVRNLNEETMSLFRELPETVEDYSGDMELSDCESQTEIFTTSPEKMAREGDIFAESFQETPPGHIVLDIDFSSDKIDDSKSKDNEIISDDEELIREQIQRVIARSSSTDEDSNDVLMIRPPTTSYQIKKDCELIPTMATILGTSMLDVPVTKEERKLEETVIEVEKEILPPVEEKSLPPVEKQQISPALQETDSTLLESIVSQPPIPLEVKLEESAKELSNIKTGTKIADSILQKLNSIKNEMEAKGSLDNEEDDEPKAENQEESEEQAKEESQSKYETITEPQEEPQAQQPAEKPELLNVPEPVPEIREEQTEEQDEDIPSPPIEEPVKKRSPSPKILEAPEQKKRKKVLSRAFIDESDSDSSDSEQLVIARSDDDSQTNSIDIKLQTDHKESDSSNMFNHGQTTDDSQSQEERNFNFDRVEEVKTREPTPPFVVKEEGIKEEDEAQLVKEEESDPHLHSLLLCEEEIPRSPAPPTETQNGQEVKPMKSVLEMPFASAPGTSNSKSMLLDQKPHQKLSPHLELALQREAQRQEVVASSPPTTPESSVSNLSPRGDASGLSPAAGDVESCRSNDVEVMYQSQRRGSSAKVSPYSEEDTQMTTESPTKRLKELAAAASCKRRRKSQRSSDDTMPPSMKKVKKTMNRSRQNSDSDDTSDHSNNESSHVPSYDRSNRSPRPNKYNFFVEFDPSLDSGQRIALLQQKISDLRKTYADVKAELAVVERRRKKIKRREREAIKAAKQEMTCA